MHSLSRAGARAVALAVVLPTLVAAQDQAERLRRFPAYEQYTRMQPQLAGAARLGVPAATARWSEDGRSYDYPSAGKWYRFDAATRQVSELAAAPPAPGNGGRGGRGGGTPERGRQYTDARSPDGAMIAVYRDRNVYIGPDTARLRPVTTDGSVASRVKYGTASWVYGEELDQSSAMWWSPDGRKLAYYRFDETGVPDYLLQLRQTQLYSEIDQEAYPKAGYDNPVVDLFVYDVATGQSTRIDVRDGRPFADSVVGYYVYNVRWSPDGREITFNRKNRRQQILEYTACAPDSGRCRVVVREEWPTGWLENNPPQRWLADNRRFIWESERNGFANFYLYDFATGRQVAQLTNHPFEVASIVRVDEGAGTLHYMARSGDNHLKLQLHRVGLDGRGARRLTDSTLNHTITPSPDGRHFVDVAQAHNRAPVTRVIDANGAIVKELLTSDLTRATALGLRPTESFTFLAADGRTRLRGNIQYPSNFDPSRKYPVLVPVYGGPASASSTAFETYRLPSALTEAGFIVVNLDSRAAPGMGKRVLDAIYLKLGQVEMDDMAAGVRALHDRPYIDRTRVGVYGTSYGGYAAIMLLLRHPEVFQAASASSPVTDWRHYDTIYTERYMWTPQGNREGYDKGSAMPYAGALKGRLMLFYGTADNNVHPSNMMQFIQSLRAAGKSFELQVGPDVGHAGLGQPRMLEFFLENLGTPRTTVTP